MLGEGKKRNTQTQLAKASSQGVGSAQNQDENGNRGVGFSTGGAAGEFA